MTNQEAAIASAVKQIPTSYNSCHTRNDDNYNKPIHQAYNENKRKYLSHYAQNNHPIPPYNNTRPSQQHRSANNSALIRPEHHFVRKLLRWAPKGDPICSFCDMRRICWVRYPEQKPVNYRANNNNSNRPQHAQPKKLNVLLSETPRREDRVKGKPIFFNIHFAYRKQVYSSINDTGYDISLLDFNVYEYINKEHIWKEQFIFKNITLPLL